MKKLSCILAVVVLVCLMSTLFAGCGANPAEPYIGVWYGYKVVADSSEIVFSDYAALVKMELTAEFKENGEYELHYYVANKEGDAYPKTGTYEMDGERIVLPEEGGYGEIVDGELILYFDNGMVKQYFKNNA